MLGAVWACGPEFTDPADGTGGDEQGPPSVEAVWFEENFTSYGSVSGDPTQDFKDDINGWWDWREISDPKPLAEIVNDEIPGLGPVQAYRQGQWHQCKPGSGTGAELALPNPEPEIWVEVYVKFSPTYRTDWTAECGDVANPDHKFIFFSRTNATQGSRWQFKVGNFGHDVSISGPTTSTLHLNIGDLPNACWNDVWQRWRFHLKGATTPTSSDGFMEARRVDLTDPSITLEAACSVSPNREYRVRVDNEADHHDGFDLFKLGVTFNVGPQADQHWQYGPIRVWRQDPGWGW